MKSHPYCVWMLIVEDSELLRIIAANALLPAANMEMSNPKMHESPHTHDFVRVRSVITGI